MMFSDEAAHFLYNLNRHWDWLDNIAVRISERLSFARISRNGK
jgi:hypothetical protein